MRRPLAGLSVNEIKELSRKVIEERIKAEAFKKNMLDGGAETGTTYRWNQEAFGRIKLRMSVIHEVKNSDTSVNLFGMKLKTPIIPAPMGGSVEQLMEDVFKEIIKGSKKAGTIATVGMNKRHEIEEICEYGKKAACPIIWIVKPLENLDKLLSWFRRAEKAGCTAVGIDMDSIGNLKYRDSIIHASVGLSAKSAKTLRKIKSETDLPFVIKGLLSVEDALKAVDAGVDVIVVSNHGGSALDYSDAPIEVLPEIVEAVKDKIDVLVDGGFRRGTDVLKALALGAKAVLIGRPIIWGLAAGGADGVFRVIEIMTNELRRAMILTGVGSAEKVPKSILSARKSSI